MAELLKQINLPHACFALVVRIPDGVVIDAPPVARWTIGRYWVDVRDYYKGKGAIIKGQQQNTTGSVLAQIKPNKTLYTK